MVAWAEVFDPVQTLDDECHRCSSWENDMTATARRELDDMPLVHEFIRMLGRRPTEVELREYRRSGVLVRMQLRHRVRLARRASSSGSDVARAGHHAPDRCRADPGQAVLR